MPDNFNYNSFVSGLLSGLKGLGEGYVKQKTQQNAMDIYNQYADKLSRNYEETMFRTQNVLKGINPKREEYEQQQKEKVTLDKGVENEKIQGLINTLSQLTPMQEPRQQVQAPNRPIPNNTDYLKTTLEGIGKLGMNPYGKTYASALEMLYKDMTAPDELKSFDTDKDVWIKDKQTGIWKVLRKGEKIPKLQQVTGIIPTVREEGGKYYVKVAFRDEKGDIVFKESEISGQDYLVQKDKMEVGSTTAQERSDINFGNWKEKKEYLRNFPLPNSGKKSKKTAKEIASELGKDALAEIEKYHKVSAEFYGEYKTFDPNTSDPKKLKLQNQLVAEREKLAGKYFNNKGEELDELTAYYFGEGKNMKGQVNKKVQAPNTTGSTQPQQQEQQQTPITKVVGETFEKIKQLKQPKRTYERSGIPVKVGKHKFDVGRQAGRDALTKYLYKLYNETEDKESFLNFASNMFNTFMQDPEIPNDFKEYISRIQF